MLTIMHSESSLGWGGQENRTLHECLGLKRLGARVIVFCKPDSVLGQRAAEAGIEVIVHPMRSNRDISAIRRAVGIIRDERVDVVSTHSGVDSLICALAGRFSSVKPVIVRTRHLALPITSRLTYSMLPHMVVTVSESVRAHLIVDKGIPSGRVVTVPTGIDLKRFDPDAAPDTLRRELELDEDALVVGTVAILRRKKGHHVLLDAIPEVLREAPGAVFVFAGDGPQRGNIEDRINALGLTQSVRLLGLRTDVPAILKGLDLFVLPTLQEALGTSILEASAMRRAVVATRVGGVPEAVADGVTGVLVPPEDATSLAAAMIRLLKDAGLRTGMGERGREMVEREYSTDRMAERMFELYTALARERKR
ncbi:MAG: glycosyltransferase family 4 protein [Deltaproteobacteria bacterium]|nr:glycosyltransferase family 4 protein [Deltaproteobacteria bacterium]